MIKTIKCISGDNVIKKIETVKNYIGAMKVEQRETGYYVRFRKSKSNKIKADQYCEILELEDDALIERISDYEFIISEKELNELYDSYMRKLFAREV